MLFFLRHPNFSHSIKDLYVCGGSVHPFEGKVAPDKIREYIYINLRQNLKEIQFDT